MKNKYITVCLLNVYDILLIQYLYEKFSTNSEER